MGGSNSKKEFTKGQILIKLDSNHVINGQPITGQITYHLDEEYPTDSLTLELIGKEKFVSNTSIKANEPGTQNMVTTKSTKKILVQQTKLIQKFDDKLKAKGTKTFNFSFQFSPDLPSSIYFVGDKNLKMYVQYKLFARMEDASGQKQKYNPLICKRLVIISQQPEEVKFDQSHMSQHHLKHLFLINAGVSKALAYVEKDAFTPKDTIKLRLELDNSQCDQELRKAKVRFYREITASTRTSAPFLVKDVILKRRVIGVPPKTSQPRDIDLPLAQINYNSDKYFKQAVEKKKFLYGQYGEWIYQLQPSVKTLQFECKYYIEVSFKHNGLNFGKSIPPIKIPIQIFNSNNVVGVFNNNNNIQRFDSVRNIQGNFNHQASMTLARQQSFGEDNQYIGQNNIAMVQQQQQLFNQIQQQNQMRFSQSMHAGGFNANRFGDNSNAFGQNNNQNNGFGQNQLIQGQVVVLPPDESQNNQMAYGHPVFLENEHNQYANPQDEQISTSFKQPKQSK